MEFEQIIYEARGDIRIIKFNRPQVFNCIGPQTHKELVAAWDDFRADDSAKVAIITGAGDKAFSSGGDIKAGITLVPSTAS